MARGTRTVYPGERNIGQSSTFQLPEAGRNVQRLKCCDKHGEKDEDSSPKNLNDVHNTSFQKYRHSNICCHCIIFKMILEILVTLVYKK